LKEHGSNKQSGKTIICFVCILLLLGSCDKNSDLNDTTQQLQTLESHPPVEIGQVDFRANLVTLPDGTWEVYTAYSDDKGFNLQRTRSTDEGRTWSEPRVLREMPGNGWAGAVSLLDRDNEVHLFFSRWRQKEGRKPAVDRFIDLWHLRSTDGCTKWTEPQRVFKGYCGSIQGAVQLRSGRIVLPFARWVAGQPCAPPTGCNETTVVFSDDGGMTWKQSESALTSPCYPDYNGNNYGFCEPVILELKDGRAWMLGRSQTGFLYESFSNDGEHWSKTMPSPFHSSTSPPYILRLPDDRIVLFWNNCEMPPRVDGAGVYGGRDQMHAAVSEDEGKTWRGYREVFRDPYRNESPPKRGDRGTAYPHAVVTKDNKIALVTGQGYGRRGLILISPQWLLETHCEDDFSDGLDNWIVFKAFGPARGWWRDRTQGPQLIDHPHKTGAKVLHIRRPDEKAGDGAVWNFPLGRQGKLAIKMMLQKGFSGASIALTDRFFNPTDDNGEEKALFYLPIHDNGTLQGGANFEHGHFYKLELDWDVDRRHCRVLVDDLSVDGLPLLNETSAGACYLRLRSTALSVDTSGWLVESVEVNIQNQLRE